MLRGCRPSSGGMRPTEAREEARTRTIVLAGWLGNDYHQREVEYQRQIQEHQNTIVELLHDVHRLNNIINPIPPPVVTKDEEEDLKNVRGR